MTLIEFLKDSLKLLALSISTILHACNSLLQENGDSGKPITYLKVDVEGTELGMSSLLSRGGFIFSFALRRNRNKYFS